MPRSKAFVRLVYLLPRLTVIGAVVGASVFIAWLPRDGVLPTCVIYETTGHYCPGCGGMRAVHDLLRGDVLRALQDNALVPIGFLIAIPVAIEAIRLAWSGRSFVGAHPRLAFLSVAALLVTVAAVALLRNGLRLTWAMPT